MELLIQLTKKYTRGENMRVLLLLRGSAGCGKSTWIEQHGLKQYALSADDIRMIKKYWECHCTEDVIVSIEISRDGKNYERINEVASPYNMYDVEFLNDWWEGERYVRVNGIQGISGIKCENI